MGKIVKIEYVVNDFVLILSLDSFYRDCMKKYEAEDLLPLVKNIFEELKISPGEFPVEGYYYETDELKSYFNHVKTLQTLEQESIKCKEKIYNMSGYKKLTELFCSGLYGIYEYEGFLLPAVRDPIYYSLKSLQQPEKWNAENILNEAYTIIKDTEDTTIVGLGILLKNPVIVTALKESVVLYNDILPTGELDHRIKYIYKYIWNVSKEIENLANKIIEIFNGICPYRIPIAVAENAKKYYNNFSSNPIKIRCVKIGYDNLSQKYYHWAINNVNYNYKFVDFWDTKLWTTEDAKKDSYEEKELQKIKWDKA